MSMELINKLQSDILESLGRYGFLTVSQFQVLTGKSAGYIREMLGSLSRRGFVRSFRIEVSYQVRSENMYVITPLSVEFLTSHKNIFPDDLKITTTQVVVKDFFHRFNTVWVNIYLHQFLTSQNIPIELMLSYFDKQGNAKKGTLTARTMIPLDGKGFYIPDSLIKTEKALYLVEMYCDKDTKRIINQLATHAKAIALGSPGLKFDIRANPFVLSAFEHPGIKASVVKRLKEFQSFERFQNLFFFATLDEVKNNCGSAWQTVTGAELGFI